MGEQFLTHVATDECYIQLGKNAKTCFVKNKYDAIHPAPKHLLVWGGISVRGPCPIMILRGKESIVNSAKYQRILDEKYLQWSRCLGRQPSFSKTGHLHTQKKMKQIVARVDHAPID
ncbi:hypothetical protein PRIPAC_96793, partial [Pristionchus pacificus]|uniref:Uncharacterized protein n=1 Tax=Pristionchus pacificus TaxID=54126 RepID=A0A2A6BCU2_PRIPA